MYLNIIIYYNTNPFRFNENKSSLKNGYIFLCVYYAFIFNGIPINREKLMIHFDKARLNFLPTAEKNMKMIFPNLDFKKNLNLNFLNNSLNIKSNELKSIIENVIEATKNFVPSTQLGVYSIIYFVCNEWFPYRVKIIFESKETFVTYNLLNQIFEHFSSSTVRKITDQLRKFYIQSF